MDSKNPKTLKEILRKSPALNAGPSIFENVDFSWSSLKITKLNKF